MRKEDMIKQLASRNNLDERTVESLMDSLIAELASPYLFPMAGEVKPGFINDKNYCNNK